MSVQLHSIQDERDPMSRLTRKECEYVARFKGIDEVEPGMPQPLMVRILKQNQVTGFRSIVDRGLGAHRRALPAYDEWVEIVTGKKPVAPTTQNAEVSTVNAEDDLMAQWKSQKAVEPKEEREAVDVEFSPEELKKNISKLRAMCKERGIKYPRTAKATDLWDLLNGQDAT